MELASRVYVEISFRVSGATMPRAHNKYFAMIRPCCSGVRASFDATFRVGSQALLLRITATVSLNYEQVAYVSEDENGKCYRRDSAAQVEYSK